MKPGHWVVEGFHLRRYRQPRRKGGGTAWSIAHEVPIWRDDSRGEPVVRVETIYHAFAGTFKDALARLEIIDWRDQEGVKKMQVAKLRPGERWDREPVSGRVYGDEETL